MSHSAGLASTSPKSSRPWISGASITRIHEARRPWQKKKLHSTEYTLKREPAIELGAVGLARGAIDHVEHECRRTSLRAERSPRSSSQRRAARAPSEDGIRSLTTRPS